LELIKLRIKKKEKDKNGKKNERDSETIITQNKACKTNFSLIFSSQIQS
jgi:hypothetical protein